MRLKLIRSGHTRRSSITTKPPRTAVNLSDIVLRLAKLTGINNTVPEVAVTGPWFMNLDPFI